MSAAMWNILWGAAITVMTVTFIAVQKHLRTQEKQLQEEISAGMINRTFAEDDQAKENHDDE